MAYEYVYTYPGSGTPLTSMTITSDYPPELRGQFAGIFIVPTILAFEDVSNVATSSDLDNTYTNNELVYEKKAILASGSSTGVTGYVERAFYYDYLGRVIQTVEKNHLGGISRTSIKYDLAGNILKQHESHQRGPGFTADTKLTTFTYDVRGRMLSETASINGSTSGTVTYSYNELGQLTGKTYGNGATESMAYNIQGWLSSKNAVKSGTNLFSMNLLYYNSTRAANKFSGNIAEWQWTQGTASQNSYALSYDKLSRLLNSNRYVGGTSTNAFTEQNITYDKNGNITQLQRYGSTGSLQDNFTYNYNGATHNGNRLSSISGSVSATYAYDNNGNMTTDGRKNLAITYNVLNLQQSISQNSTTMAEYSYLSDGTKCGVVDNTTNGYDYLGSLIYNRSGSVRTLESAAFGGGRFVNTNNTILPYYYITDHLGSTRVITDNSGNVVERNDYYPFGGKHANSSYAQLTTNKQKFNGKELQTTGNTGFLDYGARMYDDVIGRWGVVDPMAEKMPWVSSYVYCSDNPVNKIDPNGRREWPVNKTYNGNGHRHENNWHASRPNGRLHQGVDVNHTGGGNTDQGAPIVATHNGTVTKIGHAGDGDGGGNRIQITSADGTVATSYMHLDATSSGLKVGSEIKEGQQIGTMGRSGAKGQFDKNYKSHLHYEILVNGEKINPADGTSHLVDPQQIIDSRTPTLQKEYNGGTLPEVTVVGQSPEAPQRPLSQIPIPEIKITEIVPNK